MQVNTRKPGIKMTKSETDRLREAAYIIGHLGRMLTALEIADNATTQDLAAVEFGLKQAADRFGYHEKPQAAKRPGPKP